MGRRVAKFTPSRYTPDTIHILEYAHVHLSTYIQLYISVLCIPHVAFNFCDMLQNILGLTITILGPLHFWGRFYVWGSLFWVVFFFLGCLHVPSHLHFEVVFIFGFSSFFGSFSFFGMSKFLALSSFLGVVFNLGCLKFWDCPHFGVLHLLV